MTNLCIFVEYPYYDFLPRRRLGRWLLGRRQSRRRALRDHEPSIFNVWHEHGKNDDVLSVLVDIPIGLPEEGTRKCDEEASKMLKSRSSTVFSIPARDVVEADDYEIARQLNGDSLGSQSWWLFPRVREVDVFLQAYEDARDKMYESHPEICYAELSGTEPASKSKDSGIDDRLRMLQERGDNDLSELVSTVVTDRRDGAEWHERISKGRIDDVLDAAVLALTAKLVDLPPRGENADYPSLPEAPEDTEEDDTLEGIAMEIVYPGRPR